MFDVHDAQSASHHVLRQSVEDGAAGPRRNRDECGVDGMTVSPGKRELCNLLV